MSSLRESIPHPASQSKAIRKPEAQAPCTTRVPSKVPRYGKRLGFLPRSAAHFQDGGSYPEVHVAQYPPALGVANSTNPSETGLASVTASAGGDASYDSIIAFGAGQNKVLHANHDDVLPKPSRIFERPSEVDTASELARTKTALLGRVEKKSGIGQVKVQQGTKAPPEYIKYTPSKQSAVYNSGASHRLIKMHRVENDPLEPPKFRHKKVPRGPGSPPVPVMHSPPRAITTKDQVDWKIPPSISNWKNPKGYTIPLDKRLAADGRGLQDVQINDNFAKLSEALYLAEQKAREAVETRARIQHELLHNQKERKEDELRKLAQQARFERVSAPAALASTDLKQDNHTADAAFVTQTELEDDEEGKRRRDEIREERRRERERERRHEASEANVGKKSKTTRDRDRDVSEHIALGQSNINATGAVEHAYDQRLFDQEQGVASGFHGDDAYDVYDRPLFHEKGAGMYRPQTTAAEGNITTKDASRTGPVEFQRQGASAPEDPFGLDAFLDEVKSGK